MSRQRKRQARLAFTPLPSSSPATKGYNKQIQDRAANVSFESSLHKDSSKRKDSGKMSKSILTPVASAEPELSDSDDDTILVASRKQSSPQPRSHRKSKQGRIDFSRSRDPSSFDAPISLPSSSHAPSSSNAGVFNRRRQRRTDDIISDDSSEEQEPVSAPRLTRSSQRTPRLELSSDSDDHIISRKPPARQVIEESEDDEDDMPTTPGITRSRPKRKRATSMDRFVVANSDDDLEIIEPPTRKRRRRRDSSSEEENDSDEATPVTPRRRLQRKRQMTQQEEDDLAEDLEDLEPSSDVENSARKPRSSQSAKKTAHQKALERLKNKRSGKPLAEEDEDEDASEGGNIDDEEEEDVTHASQPPMSSRQMFAADDDDEGFVVSNDEDNLLGVPDGIPLEFTRYGSAKPKELFKYAFEWMVQKRLNPAFPMNDEIYELTFRKLTDEVTALSGSKYTSSAWTPEFITALKARPEIDYEPLDRTQPEHCMRDHCDACNRSGHPATYQIKFSGVPYHPTTLDEVGQEEDDDDDDDANSNNSSAIEADAGVDDRPARNHVGQEVLPANHVFYVGKFCMSNAETAHSLHHWRLHLYQVVEAYLIAGGFLIDRRVVRRDGWSQRKRRKYANKVADQMESEGKVKELWTKFQDNITAARTAKLAGSRES